jgi:DNA-binding transcriptional ArsR family regulator
MEQRLNENPTSRLKEITHGNVDIETLGADTVYVLISVFYPYSMRIIGYPETAMIVWGRDMEKSFEAIAEYQEDKLNQRVKVFKALGDKTRYEVLKLLASGVTSTKAIAEEVGVSSATVSYHLNEFLTNGLISIRQKGRRSGYLINYDRLHDIIEEFKADLNFNQTDTED